MRRLFKIVVSVLMVAFVAIQFFQPEKNNMKMTATHLLNTENVPENIKTLLQNSCFDCHSNHTNYLWYHNIAPVSWMVNNHIVAGKKELNFSEWGNLEIVDKISALGDIYDETERKKMPLKEYTFMHKDAKLTDEQIKTLCNWAEKTGTELMKSML
jgi:hypothetical protein